MTRARKVPRSEIGARLREARERLGLTQTELATLVEITPLTVNRHETQGVQCHQKTLSRYAGALQVTEQWLRYGGLDESAALAAVDEYLANRGHDTPKGVAERLRKVPWGVLGMTVPSQRQIDRVAELIESAVTDRPHSRE